MMHTRNYRLHQGILHHARINGKYPKRIVTVSLLIIRGLAADILLGTDFIDKYDVCFTQKDPLTGLKKVIFGLTGWTFPFVRGQSNHEESLARFLAASGAKHQLDESWKEEESIKEQLIDRTYGMEAGDEELKIIPAELEEENQAGQDHFLGLVPLFYGGRGRGLT
jgi:hypothetical protein